MSLPGEQPVQLMQNILRLTVQTQHVEQIKQRQYHDASQQDVFYGQAFYELITPALGFFVLV